jgi:hypothetical protein
MGIQIQPAGSVLVDPVDSLVLNFLKFHRAPRKARCWVLESFLPEPPEYKPYPTPKCIKTFEDAWKFNPNPFGMLWFLDRTNLQPRDKDGRDTGWHARSSAMRALERCHKAKHFEPEQVGAFKALQEQFESGKPIDLTEHWRNARRWADYHEYPNGRPEISAKSRAAIALVAGFECAQGATFETADQAWSMAHEALFWDKGEGDVAWEKWRKARWDEAEKNFRGLFAPGDVAEHKKMLEHLAKKHKNPPPWLRNTAFLVPARGTYDIIYPPAQLPPFVWNADTDSGGSNYWEAYGTDPAGRLSGRLAWVTDVTGLQTWATGSPMTPPTGYKWAFKFTGLSSYIGNDAYVDVEWDFVSGAWIDQANEIQVAGPS